MRSRVWRSTVVNVKNIADHIIGVCNVRVVDRVVSKILGEVAILETITVSPN